jgi:hypothetical protein
MPGARLGRSGPLEARQVTPARRRSGAGPGAKQGRFSGFQISRFPRTQYAPTLPERRQIASGESGNLETWRSAGRTPRTLIADDQWELTTEAV